MSSKIPLAIGTIPILPTPTAPSPDDSVAINMNQEDNTGQLGWIAPQNGTLYPSGKEKGKKKDLVIFI